jgi:hypothetical protein
MAAAPLNPKNEKIFTRIVYACQFFYGGWFLFHGLNYWLEFYADQTIRPGPGLIPALVAAGIMDIVKVLEIVIGLALLADLYAALVIVAAWPITLMIALVNASHLKPFGVCVAVIIIALNLLMSLGHLDRYRPLLVPFAGPPSLDGLRGKAGGRTNRLPAARHFLAIVCGIAAPTLVTYWSLWFLGR